MIHESGVWSLIHKKWFFLPRRSSRSAYDEVADEYRGTNILLIADPNFTEITVSCQLKLMISTIAFLFLFLIQV